MGFEITGAGIFLTVVAVASFFGAFLVLFKLWQNPHQGILLFLLVAFGSVALYVLIGYADQIGRVLWGIANAFLSLLRLVLGK